MSTDVTNKKTPLEFVTNLSAQYPDSDFEPGVVTFNENTEAAVVSTPEEQINFLRAHAVYDDLEDRLRMLSLLEMLGLDASADDKQDEVDVVRGAYDLAYLRLMTLGQRASEREGMTSEAAEYGQQIETVYSVKPELRDADLGL